MTRLGKREETKSRSIKIVMKSVEDKSLIMGNLGRSNNAPAEFTKISVTDDYTAEEGQIIKNKLNEAITFSRQSFVRHNWVSLSQKKLILAHPVFAELPSTMKRV